MNGITDLLLGAAQSRYAAIAAACEEAARTFHDRHASLVTSCWSAAPEPARRAKKGQTGCPASNTAIEASTHELRSNDRIDRPLLRELTRGAQDAVVARGERLLATIFATFAKSGRRRHGVHRRHGDQSTPSSASASLWPDFAKCERAAKKIILPPARAPRRRHPPRLSRPRAGRRSGDARPRRLRLLRRHRRPQRRCGATSRSTREVDGLMTADPKSVPAARVCRSCNYREAAELAYYGAKVLHRAR